MTAIRTRPGMSWIVTGPQAAFANGATRASIFAMRGASPFFDKWPYRSRVIEGRAWPRAR